MSFRLLTTVADLARIGSLPHADCKCAEHPYRLVKAVSGDDLRNAERADDGEQALVLR